MALDKPTLHNSIRTITDALWANPEGLTPEACREKFATDLSNAIDAFVRTGLVNVTVTTTGTAAAQAGSGTGNIT